MNFFPEKGLRSIRVITKVISQPVAIACYSKDDEDLVAELESILNENRFVCENRFTYEDVLTWCKNKGLLVATPKAPKSRSRKFQ